MNNNNAALFSSVGLTNIKRGAYIEQILIYWRDDLNKNMANIY